MLKAIQIADKIDTLSIRKDFPILQSTIGDNPLVYLDNAASSQKPIQVIEAVANYYKTENANVHRGIHHLSDLATRAYEGSRERIAHFIGATKEETIFTSGTTFGLNLLARVMGDGHLKQGDHILLSEMEHHSNIVPWQMLADRIGLEIKYLPVNQQGEWEDSKIPSFLTDKIKLVSLSHTSNSLGTINEYSQISEFCSQNEIPFILDGAQLSPHGKIDVKTLGCDFLVFSGHKMCGPTGIGILWGKKEWLNRLPPFIGGGDMIKTVSLGGTTYNDLPYKYEAGTPNVGGAVGLGAAVDYLESIGMDNICAQEQFLTQYTLSSMADIPEIELVGTPGRRAPVISFNVKGVHSSDVGSILNMMGVAVRTGNHCTQPLMQCLGINGTIRASFSFYNTASEVEILIKSLRKAIKMLS